MKIKSSTHKNLKFAATFFHPKKVLTLLSFVAMLCFAQNMTAQTDLWWTGATNNNWTEGSNWSTTTKGEYMGIRYEELIPVPTKAIQEQNDLIATQAAELDALKAEMTGIKAMLSSSDATDRTNISEKE